ncbi:MAG: hypothetical protein JWP29_3280 [Rhodoferax sp.]|nr:hypothetical protein [Rhodoferax sp.]
MSGGGLTLVPMSRMVYQFESRYLRAVIRGRFEATQQDGLRYAAMYVIGWGV